MNFFKISPITLVLCLVLAANAQAELPGFDQKEFLSWHKNITITDRYILAELDLLKPVSFVYISRKWDKPFLHKIKIAEQSLLTFNNIFNAAKRAVQIAMRLDFAEIKRAEQEAKSSKTYQALTESEKFLISLEEDKALRRLKLSYRQNAIISANLYLKEARNQALESIFAAALDNVCGPDNLECEDSVRRDIDLLERNYFTAIHSLLDIKKTLKSQKD